MVAAVLGGQAEAGVPPVEPELPVFTPAIPLLAGGTTLVLTPELTPHAANAGPDAPIAAEATIAASTVALQMAGNLEALVRIGVSSRRSGESTQAALHETWDWSMSSKTDGIFPTVPKQYGDVPSNEH
jgi:hypothetical protein